MQWMGLNEIREKYLSFFESKGHLRAPSFSLVPQGDKSLLLINAGMAPLKKYFTGELTPPRKRMTTCQKCIRTPDISFRRDYLPFEKFLSCYLHPGNKHRKSCCRSFL